MCSGRNGPGGNPVISTGPGLWLLWIGTGDSIRVTPVIHVGSTGWLINGIGGRSCWVRSVSETV